MTLLCWESLGGLGTGWAQHPAQHGLLGLHFTGREEERPAQGLPCLVAAWALAFWGSLNPAPPTCEGRTLEGLKEAAPHSQLVA